MELYAILGTSGWNWWCPPPRAIVLLAPGFPSASKVCTVSQGVVLVSLVQVYMLFLLSTGGK